MKTGHHARFILLQAIRDFFRQENFTDVLTPPLVENPGMETHIHPMQVSAKNGGQNLGYLHTSPEFHMKELLAAGFDKIFNLSYCFRDEPFSDQHRPQFLMLEWYRGASHYDDIAKDVERLYHFCHQRLLENEVAVLEKKKFTTVTVAELFQEYCQLDILDFNQSEKLYRHIEKNFNDIPLPNFEETSWDDLFFLLFLNKIEPQLLLKNNLLIKEYPAQLAALSRLKQSDPRVCERFEWYCCGLEMANCFGELTDLEEQKNRFALQSSEKEKLYGYQLPEPTSFYNSLKKGLPESSGIALGVERFLKVLTGIENPFWE